MQKRVQKSAFRSGVERYQRQYDRYTYSNFPRIEALTAAFVVSLAFGLLFFVFMKAKDLGGEVFWVAVTFLFPLIYNLFDAAMSTASMPDEFAFRLSHRFRRPINFIHDTTRPMFFMRIVLSILVAFGIWYAIAVGVVEILFRYFPPPFMRQVPFTGGG